MRECIYQWVPSQDLPNGAKASLRGVSAVSEQVVWASGSNSTVLRTLDSGKTWQLIPVPGAIELDFRDIEAFDQDTAVVMGAGVGDKSALFRTDNGGQTWQLLHVNQYPNSFYNSMAFWNRSHGIVYGDAVDERFLVLITQDGGCTWRRVGENSLPEILPGEQGYAASGTCVAVAGQRLAWFATGGPAARVFQTTDYGESWCVVNVPVISNSPTSGIFGLAFFDETHGIAVGGDYQRRQDRYENVALTMDGGHHWIQAKDFPVGLRTCAVYFSQKILLTVGSHGTDYSLDGGMHWISISQEGYYAVSRSGNTAWAVGQDGRIGKLTMP